MIAYYKSSPTTNYQQQPIQQPTNNNQTNKNTNNMANVSKLRAVCQPVNRDQNSVLVKKIRERTWCDRKSHHFYFTKSSFKRTKFVIEMRSELGNKVIDYGADAKSFQEIKQKVWNQLTDETTSEAEISVFAFCLAKTEILKKIHDLLELVKDENIFGSIYIYFDDIHDGIKMCKPFIEKFSACHFVKKITVLTPFIHRVAHELGIQNIVSNLEYLEENQMHTYFPLREHMYLIEDEGDKKSILDYVSYILDKYISFFFERKAKHLVQINKSTNGEIIKNEILKRVLYAVVLVMDSKEDSLYYRCGAGQEKKIKFIDRKKMSSASNYSIPSVLTRLLRENNLHERPIFIIGNYSQDNIMNDLCGPEFGPLTSSMICPSLCAKEEDFYLAASKTTGHFKNLPRFYPTYIFTTSPVRNTIIRIESEAIYFEKMSSSAHCSRSSYQEQASPANQEHPLTVENQNLSVEPVPNPLVPYSDSETESESENESEAMDEQENEIYTTDDRKANYQVFAEKESANRYMEQRGQKIPRTYITKKIRKIQKMSCKKIASTKHGLDKNNKIRCLYSNKQKKWVIYEKSQ